MGAVDFNCYFPASSLPSKTRRTRVGGGELYNTLSNDFLYQDPARNVIFLDNHDMTRFFPRSAKPGWSENGNRMAP